MLILNRTNEVQAIKVIHADGTRDSISLQPRGARAAKLPAGVSIDPTMIAQYKKILRTDPPLVEQPAVVDAESDE